MARTLKSLRLGREVSVFAVRAFVRLRNLLATHKELAEKVTELERKLSSHDEQIEARNDAFDLCSFGPLCRRNARLY